MKFHPVESCHLDIHRSPKGIELLNQLASLRGVPVQHALNDVLTEVLPAKITKLRQQVKVVPRKKRAR